MFKGIGLQDTTTNWNMLKAERELFYVQFESNVFVSPESVFNSLGLVISKVGEGGSTCQLFQVVSRPSRQNALERVNRRTTRVHFFLSNLTVRTKNPLVIPRRISNAELAETVLGCLISPLKKGENE